MYFILLMTFLVICPCLCLAQTSLIDSIQKAQQAMVEVKTEFTKVLCTETDANNVTRQATFQRSGAGIVIDPSGIVVTNTHTIINAPFIFVILPNGKKYPAEVAYIAPGYDFSLLRISPSSPLKTITWADSSRITLNDQVIAIGNAELHSQSMLAGRITSILQNRTTSENEFIEININLYRGDSGGPVFDTRGRLLGIIMANRKSEQNASLAIAANKIREQYLKFRRNMP